MPSNYRVSYMGDNGRMIDYMVEGMRIHEMVSAAIRFMDIRAEDCTPEEFTARYEEANRFATFCVNETLDEFGEFCDPRGGFSDLRIRWRKSEAEAEEPERFDSAGSLRDGQNVWRVTSDGTPT